MKCSDRQLTDAPKGPRQQPARPDVYMPAMWPIGLQALALDWFAAWRKRRLYRRLLTLSDRQLRMRDLSRPRLMEKAQASLRQLVEEQRCARVQR